MEGFLVKNNFIGRDGFVWWIGQIPPAESIKEQFEGEAWGNRFKVRIMGYHPYNTAELSNEDLPWALVMQGVSDGSGKGNYAKTNKIRPSDIVFGFFLDGEDAQQPVITGVLGNSDQEAQSSFTVPFAGFTGYSENVKKPDKSVSTANEASDASATSQQGPIERPKDKVPPGRAGIGGGLGDTVVFADTCENTTLTTIESSLSNFIKEIQEKQADISELQQSISEQAEIIKGASGWLVGEMFKAINLFLVGDYTASPPIPGIIPQALNLLYTTVYTTTLPLLGPAAANIAATEVLEKLVLPVSALEGALICVQNAILEGLVAIIRDLLLSILDNIERFTTCVVDQFIGAMLNTIVSEIEAGLQDALGALSGILGGVIDIASIAQGAVGLFNSLEGLLDCNQVQTKCDGTKEWIVGAGPKDIMDIDQSFDNIFNTVNQAASLVNQAVNAGQGIVGDVQGLAEGVGDTVEGVKSVIPLFNGDTLVENANGAFNACLTTYPSSCGGAQIKIFGGGGSGATAIPILGPAVERTLTESSIGRNVTRTANIIGATLENVGSGYRFPPFVEIVDECGIGYGAVARATINDNGELQSIYVVSSGENYPVDNQDIYGVVDVTIVSTGLNYDTDDIAEDNFGNKYSLTIDGGKIISATPINIVEAKDLVNIRVISENGLGAVLKPVLGKLPPSSGDTSSGDTPPQGDLIQVIDCIS